MAKKKPDTKVFSPERFGRKLREERRLAGYKNTKELSEAVQELTDTYIDFDTLMKYERGEREPDVSKMVAIAVTLYGSDWRDELGSMLTFSIPEEAPLKMQVDTLRGEVKSLQMIKHAIEAKEAHAWSETLGISLANGYELAALGLGQIFNSDTKPEDIPEETIKKLLASQAFRRVFSGYDE